MASRPRSRSDFKLAIVCALPREYEAVALQIDQFWDEDGDLYGRASQDPNMYRTGCMGRSAVVLVLLSGIGKVSAAVAARSLQSSYQGLKLVLLAGVCGGVPSLATDKELLLGDVIISNDIIQYDFGRRYPDCFEVKDSMPWSLGRSTRDVYNFVSVLNTRDIGRQVEAHAALLLIQLQRRAAKQGLESLYEYPGSANDRLFHASYRHMHHQPNDCCEGSAIVCEASRTMSCQELGCSEQHLVRRVRLEERSQLERQGHSQDVQGPSIFIGRIGSGDTVLKSGDDRDEIAQRYGIVAFEMEGIGLWEEVPCIIAKGVCDYADSHKNKEWQDFAAATAASVTKALIERYIFNDEPPSDDVEAITISRAPVFTLPFDQLTPLVGRDECLVQIHDLVGNGQRRIAIWGIGGVGKTEIALSYSYHYKTCYNDSHVFWVRASNWARFEQGYYEIARQLGILGTGETPVMNTVKLVSEWLENPQHRNWLMIIDGADSADLFFGSSSHTRAESGREPGLTPAKSLPSGSQGVILMTTSNKQAALKLAGSRCSIHAEPLALKDGVYLLKQKLAEDVIWDDALAQGLVESLGCLPLALCQAAAYMNENGQSLMHYTALIQDELHSKAALSQGYHDHRRYSENRVGVFVTWEISFNEIVSHNMAHTTRAIEILSHLAFLDEQSIPIALVRRKEDNPVIFDNAVGLIKAYSFLKEDNVQGTFSMHRLVRLCTQGWIDTHGQTTKWQMSTLDAVSKALPEKVSFEFWNDWEALLPHIELVTRYNVQDEVSLLRQASIITMTAQYHRRRSRPKTSLYEARRALAICQNAFGADHTRTLEAIEAMAMAERACGSHEAAERLCRELLERREKTLGTLHPHTLRALVSLSRILSSQAKFQESTQLSWTAFQRMEDNLGPDKAETLSALCSLGNTMHKQKEYEMAKEFFQKCFEGRRAIYGADHEATLGVMANLGVVLRDQGKYDEAGEILSKAVALQEEVLGKQHSSTLSTRGALGLTLAYQDRHSDAEELLVETVETCANFYGDDHQETAKRRSDLEAGLKLSGRKPNRSI